MAMVQDEVAVVLDVLCLCHLVEKELCVEEEMVPFVEDLVVANVALDC